MDQPTYEDRLHAWELASRRRWELDERRRLASERERVRTQGLVERRPTETHASGARMPNDPNDPLFRTWDTSRPDRLTPDEAAAYEKQYRARHLTTRRADTLLRRDRDLGEGEPLRASEDELPLGPVEPGEYKERPYWALAILLIGVAALMATIIGNLAAAPVFARAPEPMQHGWPWVLSTLVGILAGLGMGLQVWPRGNYASPWLPAVVATLSGLLVAGGVFLGLWMFFGFFV